MEYYSSKEIAKKWGITPRRVTVLAKTGRIPGAWQMGHNWMIPKNAQKPQDPSKAPQDTCSHHTVYTMYFHKFDGSGREREFLNKDEQTLYDAQELFVHNDLPQAAWLLDDLLLRSTDKYIHIGALVTLACISVETKDIPLYKKCLHELHLIFAEDFPARDVLTLILADVEAHSAVRELRSIDLNMIQIHSCPPEFSPIILICVFYSALMDQFSGKKEADTTLLELLCREYDRYGYYFSSSLLHTYLACIYHLNNSIENCRFHLQIVTKLSVKYDSFYALATAYRFLGPYYDELLAKYPAAAKEKLLDRSKSFTEGIAAFDKHFTGTVSGQRSLSLRDYEYIVYALKGIKNSEIAHLKGISEPTVSKYYSSLYAELGVKNKKELVETMRTSTIGKIEGIS